MKKNEDYNEGSNSPHKNKSSSEYSSSPDNKIPVSSDSWKKTFKNVKRKKQCKQDSIAKLKSIKIIPPVESPIAEAGNVEEEKLQTTPKRRFTR